jgi:hypothetical protein
MAGENIPAAILEKWEAWYAREIGSAPTDQEELTRVREYLARARDGFTLTEDGAQAHVGRRTWTPAAVQAVAQAARPAATAQQRRVLLVVLVLAPLVACVVLAVMLGPMLTRGGKRAAPETTPGVLPTAVPVLVEVGGQKLALGAPRSLEIQGAALQVVAGEVTAAGGLKYPQGVSAEMAVWFPSPANWLLGVDARVAQAVHAGDVIVGRTATGRVLRFVVDDVRDVRPQEVEALAQQRAGLALFPLKSAGETVRVVSARYDPTGEQPEAETAPAVSSTLIVTGVGIERGRDGLYRVTIAYTATAPAMGTVLLDVDGQLYPAAPESTPGAARFAVVALGQAELHAGAERVQIGALDPPALAGEVAGVALTGTNLIVTVTLSSTTGAAWLRPGDIALQDGGEVAPAQTTPAEVYVAPGALITATLRFARPAGDIVRVRVFDELWEVTGLTP